MALYRYVSNKDPQDGTTQITVTSNGTPVTVQMGGVVDFTAPELAQFDDRYNFTSATGSPITALPVSSPQVVAAIGNGQFVDISEILAETERITFREDFDETDLDTNEWEVLQTGAGHSIGLAGASLATISTGATINTETIIRSKRTFKIPCRVMFTGYLSQRVANQEFYLELVNAAGDTYVGYMFDGTTATSAKAVNAHDGILLNSPTAITTGTTASTQEFQIDCRADGVEWYDRTADSSSTASHRLSRSRAILEPDEEYYIRIRAKNLGTAPTNTNLNLDQILVQDMTKFVVEIGSGRGQASSSRSLPVTVLNTLAANQGTTTRQGLSAVSGIWQDSTITPLAISGVFTGVSRDLSNAAAGSQFGAAHYAKEYRISAECDITGTLALEVSRDNSTWRRVKTVALAAVTGGGFYGEIIHQPSWRYARAVFVNGSAAAQVRLTVGEAQLAA